MLKTFLRRACAALGLSLALVAGPAPAKSVQPAKPALWAVSDADTTIYLFGTIHLLPDQYQWRTAKFDQAIEGSQQLVVETIIDLKHPESFTSTFAQMAISPTPLPPILERVPAAKRPTLRTALAAIGAKPEQLDRVKTWAIAFQLLGVQFARLGLEGKEGPETVLREQFVAAHKSIGQLESNSEQLSFFDRLPEDAQRQLLEGAIDDPEAFRKEFGGMLAAWVRGDVNGIARTFNHDLSDAPVLQQALIKQRNANWSKWIEQRMTQPGAIMIAVGAGHLAGPGSVIALLERDGYRVRRVQ